jgi:hypothetical protein
MTIDMKKVDPAFASIWDGGKCDVLIYCGEINEVGSDRLCSEVRKHARATRLFWILGTNGGDPDHAFRMARRLQHQYTEKITVIVPIYCKSAGTLMAIGANELVMPDNTELGPIDMQVAKHGELFEQSSSLTPQQALEVLATSSFETFERQFFNLRNDTQLPTRTCADIATGLVIGMFAPIYGQIDPMRMAEMHRHLSVARAYGARLDRGNLLPNGLDYLISAYPSHEFVIDRKEAEKLFKTVRAPTEEEQVISTLIADLFKGKMNARQPEVYYIVQPAPQTKAHGDHHAHDDTISSANPGGGETGEGGSLGASTRDSEPSSDSPSGGPPGDSSDHVPVVAATTSKAAGNGQG